MTKPKNIPHVFDLELTRKLWIADIKGSEIFDQAVKNGLKFDELIYTVYVDGWDLMYDDCKRIDLKEGYEVVFNILAALVKSPVSGIDFTDSTLATFVKNALKSVSEDIQSDSFHEALNDEIQYILKGECL